MDAPSSHADLAPPVTDEAKRNAVNHAAHVAELVRVGAINHRRCLPSAAMIEALKGRRTPRYRRLADGTIEFVRWDPPPSPPPAVRGEEGGGTLGLFISTRARATAIGE